MLGSGFIPNFPLIPKSAKNPLIHRDLSWLQFNERVLDEARTSQNPLLERAKFLAITASNLDEFFMIRVPSLERSLYSRFRALDVQKAQKLRRTRRAILESVSQFCSRQEAALEELALGLASQAIFIERSPEMEGLVGMAGLSGEMARKVFQEKILPALPSPETFQPKDILRLDNLQVGVILAENLWLRVPRQLATLYLEEDAQSHTVHAFFLDDLLGRFLPESLSKQMTVGFVRLTRDADVSIDVQLSDTESIPDRVVTHVRKRERGRPTRLQIAGCLDRRFTERLLGAAHLSKLSASRAPGTLFLHGLWTLVNRATDFKFEKRTELLYPVLDTRVPRVFQDGACLFQKICERDVLLHHPYDSFDAFVKWMKVVADDPDVISIELTVYRMDLLSPVIGHLKRAAKDKQVRVIIELRARFDELNNIRLADDLRKSGIEVAYGFGRLKLHAKVTLVTRKEKTGLVRYTHLSTGNYNSATARQYTDLSVLTANPEIGADARHFFDAVWDGRIPTSFKQLVVAPSRLARRLKSLIQHEADAARRGERARIVAKVNALVDKGIVESLYRASSAGVRIDLIVRGACSVIPGIKGLSENIRVVSIVDRFLEHSRIYYFGASKRMYLSSADWMPRNFFSRLEIAFPVLDPRIYRYIEQVVFPAYLNDEAKARVLTPQGVWRRRSRSGAVNPPRSQVLFRELAIRDYRGTPLESI